MITLFLDTHDKSIIEVLYQDSKVLDKHIKISERNHSDFTMPMLKELLERNKLNVHDINEIIIVNGPGSFTGVRLGVTIAKTLAYTLNIPIKTITSLECMALSTTSNKEKLPIIRDVKGVFACLYDQNNKQLTEPFYKSNNEFQEYLDEHNLNSAIIENNEYNYEAIYMASKDIKPTIAHSVNPIYIKVIEALKND